MAVCSCGRSFRIVYSDKPTPDPLESYCPSCRASSNPATGYLSGHEFVQGSVTSNILPNVKEPD